MEYTFKRIQEVFWAASVGAGIVVLQLALTFDESTLTDWKTWVVAGGGAIVRGAAGAALPAFLRLFKAQTYSDNF